MRATEPAPTIMVYVWKSSMWRGWTDEDRRMLLPTIPYGRNRMGHLISRQAVAEMGELEFKKYVLRHLVWPKGPGAKEYREEFYDKMPFAKSVTVKGTFDVRTSTRPDGGKAVPLTGKRWAEMIKKVVRIEVSC